jgi:iron complex outermembrane receptor protein
VLRGPQGTLFGRNATGGVINLARSKPTQDLTGKVRGTYSSFDTFDFQGVVSFGLAPNVALKVTGAYNSSDGYIYNKTFNQPGQKSDFRAIGGQLLLTPTPALEVSLSYDHQLTRQDPPQLSALTKPTDIFCSLIGFVAQAGRADFGQPLCQRERCPVDKSARFQLDMAIGKLKYELGDNLDFEYILGFLKTNEFDQSGLRFHPLTLYHTDRPARWRQVTNEARLVMGGNGPLTFVLGGYQWFSKYTINLKNYIGFAGLAAAHQRAGRDADDEVVGRLLRR